MNVKKLDRFLHSAPLSKSMHTLCTIFLCALLMVFTFSCGESKPLTKGYRIARDPAWAALSLGNQAASLFGFSDELLYEIGKQEQISLQLYVANWDQLVDGLLQKKWDGILTNMPAISPLTDTYSFSRPYMLLGDVIVVRADSSITSLPDLAFKEVGVLPQSSAIIPLAKNPTTIITIYNSAAQSLLALTAGQIDAVMLPQLVAHGFVQDLYFGKLKIASPPLTSEALYLVTLKDAYPKLIESFNKGLEAAKENGSYDRLIVKWQLQ